MNDECPTTRFFVNSRGQRLAYEYLPGTAPMVVFLSGYASDMTGSKAEYLARQCQEWGRAFLRLDYSGHGQSEGRFVDGTIGEWADDATQVIAHVNADPCVLVGSSMGGWIMLLVALAHRERVRGLVGIASAPDFTRDLMWNGLTQEQRDTLMTTGEVYLPSEYVDDPFPITRKLIEDGNRALAAR